MVLKAFLVVYVLRGTRVIRTRVHVVIRGTRINYQLNISYSKII